MKNRYVDFVSDEHFLSCVDWVCKAYPKLSDEVDMKKLGKNSLDPFKMIFDVVNGNLSVEDWIKNEEIRQKDKTINNRVGEFHQKLLGGVDGWEDLGRGHPLGIDLKKKDNSIFIELKNKHNTVKGENHKDVFDKLLRVLNQNKKSLVYYAYIIPKKPSSGEKIWNPSQRESNPQILEAWGARVYEIVTEDKDALDKTWKALPSAIKEVKNKFGSKKINEEKEEYGLKERDSKRLVEFFNSSLKH